MSARRGGSGARGVAPDAHGAVVLGGAGWHPQGGRLRVPPDVTLPPLPPYAPDANTVEKAWNRLRGNRLSNTERGTCQRIAEACCQAWNLPPSSRAATHP